MGADGIMEDMPSPSNVSLVSAPTPRAAATPLWGGPATAVFVMAVLVAVLFSLFAWAQHVGAGVRQDVRSQLVARYGAVVMDEDTVGQWTSSTNRDVAVLLPSGVANCDLTVGSEPESASLLCGPVKTEPPRVN